MLIAMMLMLGVGPRVAVDGLARTKAAEDTKTLVDLGKGVQLLCETSDYEGRVETKCVEVGK